MFGILAACSNLCLFSLFNYIYFLWTDTNTKYSIFYKMKFFALYDDNGFKKIFFFNFAKFWIFKYRYIIHVVEKAQNIMTQGGISSYSYNLSLLKRWAMRQVIIQLTQNLTSTFYHWSARGLKKSDDVCRQHKSNYFFVALASYAFLKLETATSSKFWLLGTCRALLNKD